MGLGHRYTLNHRGSKRSHSSRASRRVVMKQSTSPGHESLIPGKQYKEASTRVASPETGIATYRCCIPWEHEHSLASCDWVLVGATKDKKAREERVSVVKDHAALAKLIMERLPEIEAIMVSTILDREDLVDGMIGMPRVDVARIVDMVHTSIYQYTDGNTDTGMPLSLELLAEQGIELDADISTPRFWSIPAWEKVVDTIGDEPILWDALLYLQDGLISQGRAHTMRRVWEIGPTILH